MAYIPYISRKDASEDLKVLYERYSGLDGRVDNILRIHGSNPPVMEHHGVLYEHAMRGRSPLTRIQREMVALVVSAANDCFY